MEIEKQTREDVTSRGRDPSSTSFRTHNYFVLVGAPLRNDNRVAYTVSQ